MIASLIFAAVIGCIVVGMAFVLERRRKVVLDTAYYQKHWSQIEQSVQNGQGGARLAVIDADKLLDHALKQRHVRGKTMGERLRHGEGLFRQYQDIWDAHKLRNRLVHEAGVEVRVQDAQDALKVFKQGLRDMGAL